MIVETASRRWYFFSEYSLELNAGITEIFIYTDIVESHHVGDTVAPLLHAIPVMTEKEDQIIRVYTTPLYFALRKKIWIQYKLNCDQVQEQILYLLEVKCYLCYHLDDER